MRRNMLGLTLGLALGWFGTPVVLHAQTPTKYKIDAANGVCWDQPHTTLADANAMHVRVTYDTAPAADAAFACTGSTSPFTCKLNAPIPMTVQTVGLHRIVIEGANLDATDGSYTAYAELVNFQVDLANAAQPPQKGGNGRLVKILGLILAAIVGVVAWLT